MFTSLFNRSGRTGLVRLWARWVWLLALASGVAAGCVSQSDPADQEMLSVTERQSALVSLSDDVMFTVAEACDRVEMRTSKPEVRLYCASKRLGTAVAAVAAATNKNATIGFVDLLTLVTLQRMSLEEPWALEHIDQEDRLVLHGALAGAEAQAWEQASGVLTTDEREALREMIAAWRMANPERLGLASVRLQEFAAARQTPLQSPRARGQMSLLRLMMLDPMANIDPVKREVVEARLLAERVSFWAARLPMILGWQAELTSARMMNSEEIRGMMQGGKQISEAAGELSGTAGRLADSYDRMLDEFPGERVAAIDQMDRAVAARLKALVDQTAAATTAERTAAVEQMGVALTHSLETAVGRLSSELDTQSQRSFDRAVKLVADERDQLSVRVTAHLAELDAASERLVDRIAMRLVVVVVVGALAVACVMFVYRRIEARFGPGRGAGECGNECGGVSKAR